MASSYEPFEARARVPLRPSNPSLRNRRALLGGGVNSLKPKPQDLQSDCPRQQHLAKLQAAAEQRIDGSHTTQLRELWECANLGHPYELVSPRWLTLGFQQDNPRADLRGCGALGLRQLLHFVRKCPPAVLPEAAESAFPLAASSLNVTLALCTHLRLLPTFASSAPLAARPTQSHFLRLSMELEPALALDLMHAELLRGLAELWSSMQRPGLTPMAFPEAMALMNAHLAEALAGCSPPWQLSEVLMRLRAVGSDLSGQEISAMADICSGVAKGTVLGDFVSGMLLGPSGSI